MLRRIKTLLQRANLRDEEIAIYLLLLKLQTATLPELQEQSSMTHITTYRTVNRLIERGLIEATPINQKQQIYKPLSLGALIRRLEKEQRKMRQLELSLRDLDPLLPYISDANDTLGEEGDMAEMIEVKEGAEALQEEYLRIPELCNGEFLAMGSSESFWEASQTSIDSHVERSFVSRRLRNNVYSRILMVACDDAEEIQSKDSREKRTTKQREELPVMNDCLMICQDQISHFLCDPENPRVLTIKHPELVKLQKNHFETIWKGRQNLSRS